MRAASRATDPVVAWRQSAAPPPGLVKQQTQDTGKDANTATKAGVVVYDPTHHKVLTVSNEWDQNIGLPKGSVEPGEGVEAAAFRELREETGLSLSPADARGPPIVMDLYSTRIAWYLVAMPNGSVERTRFAPQAEENIGFVKWRTLAELRAHLAERHVNQTIANRGSIRAFLLDLLQPPAASSRHTRGKKRRG